jgi:glycerate kinase
VAVVAGLVVSEGDLPVARAVALTDVAGSVEAAMADPARWLLEAGARLAERPLG